MIKPGKKLKILLICLCLSLTAFILTSCDADDTDDTDDTTNSTSSTNGGTSSSGTSTSGGGFRLVKETQTGTTAYIKTYTYSSGTEISRTDTEWTSVERDSYSLYTYLDGHIYQEECHQYYTTSDATEFLYTFEDYNAQGHYQTQKTAYLDGDTFQTNSMTYSYDSNNYLIEEDISADSTSGTFETHIVFTNDSYGNPTTLVQTLTSPCTTTNEYTYDSHGNILTKTTNIEFDSGYSASTQTTYEYEEY